MRRGPFGREATGYRWRRGKGEPVSLGSSYGSGPAFCPETHMGGARVCMCACMHTHTRILKQEPFTQHSRIPETRGALLPCSISAASR